MMNIPKGDLLLLFTATWCGHCKLIYPKIEKYSKFHNIRLIKFDDSESIDHIMDQFNIEYYPTLIQVKDSKYIKIVGYDKILNYITK